jgi:hypothetical protein
VSRRSIILVSIASALLIGAGIFAFIRLRKSEAPVRDPLEGIPVSAFCVLSSDNIRETWNKFNQGNLVWDACLETGWARKVSSGLNHIDSIVSSDAEISALLNTQKTWLSLHCTGKEAIDYVVVAALPSVTAMDDFSAFLEKNSAGKKITKSEWKKAELITIGNLHEDGFITALSEGLVIISGNEELLKSALDQLEKGNNLRQDPGFAAVRQTAGEKTAGNIYLKYPALTTALKRISNDVSKERLEDLATFAEWTEVDLSLHPNALLLNGYTNADDSSASYLAVMHQQEIQRVEVDQVLPATTISYIDYGISNIGTWFGNYENYLDRNGRSDARRKRLNELAIDYTFSPEEGIGKWLGNEIAVAELPSATGEITSVAFLSTVNTAVAKESLAQLRSRDDSSASVSPDSAGYFIRKIPVPGMLPVSFGVLFSDLAEGWYTVIRQYVVFAPDEKTLRAVIAANESGQTLARNHAYSDFSKNMVKEASITFYVSPGQCQGTLRSRASAAFADDLEKHTRLLRRFDGFSAQFSAGNNNLFYTNIFLRHNPQGKKEITTLWETQLDSSFSGKPWLVQNHKTKTTEIFVQDDANTIYLISSTGTILWKRAMPEKIIGDVRQVDALKNGKLQLIFNTASNLYVIDRNGADLSPFPVKLPATATNPVLVLDYENNREYRLLIACADKKIYNYTIKGTKVDGWKLPATSDVVLAALQHVVIGGKDYVIAVDRQGKSYITDRQGNTRLQLKNRLHAHVTQFFIETGKDISRTRLVSSDSLGNVSRLSLSDELERMHFLDFREEPGFAYRDIDGDGSLEFIFLDSRNLLVFNQDKLPVISYPCAFAAIAKPAFFTFDNKDVRIGIVYPGETELHLINKGGADTQGFPLPGNTLFAIGKLGSGDALTLVCGNNQRYLCAYPLK